MKRRMICLALAFVCLLSAALTGCRKKTDLPDNAPVEDRDNTPVEPAAPEGMEEGIDLSDDGIDTSDTPDMPDEDGALQTAPEQDDDVTVTPEEPDDPVPPEETPDEGGAYTPGENETSIIWFG